MATTSGHPASGQRGTAFIIAGASGSGKSSICKRLEAEGLGLFSVSHTTRRQSAQETDGVDYHFVTDQAFKRMVAEDQLLEWAQVHGNCYGTSQAWLEQTLLDGKDVFLEIDVQGAAQARKRLAGLASVFILPPSFAALKERLLARKREQASEIETRLRTALAELRRIGEFDYLVVNDSFDKAYADVRSIVLAGHGGQDAGEAAQRLLTRNQPDLLESWCEIDENILQ